MNDSQATVSPYSGLKAITDAFEEYQDMSSTYIETQQAVVDGLQESTRAMEHYARAYELWLSGWNSMLVTDTKSETHSSTPEQAAARPSLSSPVDRSSGRHHNTTHQPTATPTTRATGSDVALRERIATLEQRQQELEGMLDEIHREVIE
ncbi:hypothetical protein [Natronorubrum thiooxidans]|nr:hypothetical protein [Natronorubrum thiooxidans]